MLLLKHLFVIAFVMATAFPLQGVWAAADLPGSQDHQEIARVAGTTIMGFAKSGYDEGVFMTGTKKREILTENIEGKRTRILYMGPKDLSPLGVFRHYQKVFAALGEVEEIYICKERDCFKNLGEFVWSESNRIDNSFEPSRYLYSQPYYYTKQAYWYGKVTTAISRYHVAIYAVVMTEKAQVKETRHHPLINIEIVETADFNPTLKASQPELKQPPPPSPKKVERRKVGSTLVSPSTSHNDFGRYHALVIGNAKYQHLDNLKTAINDAEAVGTLLQNAYGFTVTTLRNAERDTIIESLDHLRAKLTDKDNLLIYYGGHGIFDEKAEEGFWLPVDARDNTTARWLSNKTITNKLKAMTAKHVLVVVDSCYAGTLTRGVTVRPGTGQNRQSFYKTVANKRSRTVLTSGGLEPVLDGGGDSHSIFAKSFLNALRTNKEVLDGRSIYEQIRRPILLNARQQPKYDAVRFAGHEVGGDFLFVPHP